MRGHVGDWLADVDDASEELVARELDREGKELDRVKLRTRAPEELVKRTLVMEGNKLERVELVVGALGELVARRFEIEGNELERVELVMFMFEEFVTTAPDVPTNELERIELVIGILEDEFASIELWRETADSTLNAEDTWLVLNREFELEVNAADEELELEAKVDDEGCVSSGEGVVRPEEDDGFKALL